MLSVGIISCEQTLFLRFLTHTICRYHLLQANTLPHFFLTYTICRYNLLRANTLPSSFLDTYYLSVSSLASKHSSFFVSWHILSVSLVSCEQTLFLLCFLTHIICQCGLLRANPLPALFLATYYLSVWSLASKPSSCFVSWHILSVSIISCEQPLFRLCFLTHTICRYHLLRANSISSLFPDTYYLSVWSFASKHSSFYVS